MGHLISVVPPASSALSNLGIMDLDQPYPRIHAGEGTYSLSWKFVSGGKGMDIQLLLTKFEGTDGLIVDTMTMPAVPFSAFYRTFQNLSAPDLETGSLQGIFDWLADKDGQMAALNEQMAGTAEDLNDLLRKWIEPGETLEMLSAQLYMFLTTDMAMIQSLGNAGPDAPFFGKK